MLLVLQRTSATVLECPAGEMLVFAADTGKASCEKCPENCYYCYMYGEKKMCARCPEGFYLDQGKQCQKCVEKCASCTGPEYSKCYQLAEGHSLDVKQKKPISCPEGCRECSPDGECVNCLPGFLPTSKQDANKKAELKHGIPIVTCSKCNDLKCNYCFNQISGYETCLICKEGFGFNKRQNVCQKCKVSDCEECANNYQKCSRCNDNFFVSLADGLCHKMPAHCQHIDPMSNGNCMTCKLGYTLDTSTHKCVACKSVNELCTTCGFTKVKHALVCRGCVEHHFWSRLHKECRKCSENCVQCSSSSKCKICQFGFQLEDGKCKPQEDSNCRILGEAGKCFECERGHYFDEKEKKCHPCAAGCGSCSGSEANQCTTCYVDKFALIEGTIQTYQKMSCVESCPAEEKGKKLIPDYFNMRCIPDDKPEEIKPTEKYSFRRTQKDGKVTKETLSFDVKQFGLELTKYIEESTKSFREWAVKNPYMKNEFSEQCNYRGKLIQKISLTREVHLVCKCSRGFHDLTCSIETMLYEQIQKFARSILNDLVAVKPSGEDQGLSEIFIGLSAGSLSETTLTEMVDVISGLVNRGDQICGNVVLIMKMFDSVIWSNYNYGYEVENKLDITDIDSAKFKYTLYRRLHRIMELQKEAARKCFTSGQTDEITMASTSTFQSVLRAYHKGLFEDEIRNAVAIPPPNIFGTSSITRPIFLNYISKNLEALNPNPLLVYPVVYSSMLFDQYSSYDYIISSYMVSPILLCAQTKSEDYNCSKAFEEERSLKVRFLLRHMTVADGEIRNNLKCLQVNYSDTELKPLAMVESAVSKFETEGLRKDLIAVCEFEKVNRIELADVYYTVGFKKEAQPTPQHKSEIEKIWEETNDSSKVQLPVYPRKPKAKSSTLLLLKLAIGSLCALTYLM